MKALPKLMIGWDPPFSKSLLRRAKNRLCFVLFLGLVSGCGELQEAMDETGEERPNAELSGLTLRSTLMGRIQWIFSAEEAFLYENRRSVDADQIRIEYFKNEKKISDLTADKAVVDTETHHIVSTGNVILVAMETGEQLHCEILNWDAGREMIYTEAPVTVYKGKNVIRAVGLEADPELGEIVFMKDVHMDIRDVPVLTKGPASEQAPSR